MQPKDPQSLTEKEREQLSALAKTYMTEARTALILDDPFFGVMAMKLELVEDWTAETWWTDGVSLGYNPAFTCEINRLERKGVMGHEVLHCANGHPWRRENRDPEDWNDACDESINPELKAAGYMLPEGVLLTPAYQGKSAEWIYEQMFRKKQQGGGQQGKQGQGKQQGQPQAGNGGGNQQQPGQQPQNGQPQQGGQPQNGQSQQGNQPGQQPQNGQQQGNPQQNGQSGGGQPGQNGQQQGGSSSQPGQPGQNQGQPSASGTPKRKPWGEVRDAPKDVDPKQLAQEWTIITEQAARIATQAGKAPGFMKELVKRNREPQVDWREALWHFVQTSVYSPDYQYRRPHRNYIHMGLYMPSLEGIQMPPMMNAKDSSGSISAEQTAMFNAEYQSVLDSMNPESSWELIFDTRVTSERELMPGDDLTSEAVGRGGTDARCVFKWVEEKALDLACAIISTDLDTPFPTTEPDYPVLWLCPPGVTKVPPFGTKIEIPYVYPNKQ